jgi:hypothetical protein
VLRGSNISRTVQWIVKYFRFVKLTLFCIGVVGFAIGNDVIVMGKCCKKISMMSITKEPKINLAF